MGLRLKGQLLALFFGLFFMGFGVIIYFNMTLSASDNLLRTEHAGRRLADLVVKQALLGLRDRNGEVSISPFVNSSSQKILTDLQQFTELRQFDVFTAEGQRVFGVGSVPVTCPLQPQALQFVIENHEPFSKPWAYPTRAGAVSEGYPLDSVTLFFRGRVCQEHYHPLLDSRGQLVGILHLALEIPRVPLRMNLAVMGNLILAAIFLITSGLAFYLWSEFALHRPLKSLLEAHTRLLAIEPSHVRDAVDPLIASNELATLAQSFNRLTLEVLKTQRELQEKTRRLETANQSYRQLNEELEQRVEEKTREMKEFFSLITHDLRIPLAAVAGYVDLLARPKASKKGGDAPPDLSDKQKKYLGHIREANVHAQDLVRNLLDAMRYEFGRPELVTENFDLCELAHEIVAHVHVQGDPIALELPEAAAVHGDRSRIGRVLGNLLGNAVRHASQVKVRILEAGETWSVEVADQGPGIPTEQLPHLFDKFKHIQAQEGSSGLGLGLYIVKRILLDHGQDITVESQPGQGTRFRFALPKPRAGEKEAN